MSNSTTNQTDEVESRQDRESPQEQPADAAASVDKIRDIIFGPQIKSYDARFSRLEESLSQQTAELKSAMRHQLESIQSLMQGESATAAARLAAEREERAFAHRQPGAETRGCTNGSHDSLDPYRSRHE